jgi:serine/threonine-protein kinase HipA
VAGALAIWLYGHQVAIVEKQRNNRLRLSYTEYALDTYEGGTPLLSLAFPLTRERYPNAATRAFLDGLLPEGEPRRAIAQDLDLPASDVFGLLAVLGKDSAGALVVQPDDALPPPRPTTLSAEPITTDDLGELIANLHRAPLGIDRNVRLSLAGVQEKLPLTRMPDGTWGRPIAGTPSTHILKPEIEPFQNTVENELFCMSVAKNLGLSVAPAQTILVDERPVLVVERYDRVIDPDGTVHRVHQEDFCQALGLPPEKKCEQDGGPSLARIARVLQDFAEPSAPEALLRALTVNVALGNCEAHAKNYSLLHTPHRGSAARTPLRPAVHEAVSGWGQACDGRRHRAEGGPRDRPTHSQRGNKMGHHPQDCRGDRRRHARPAIGRHRTSHRGTRVASRRAPRAGHQASRAARGFHPAPRSDLT